ncbi:MAG: 2Fe-2S iron-sulfur cluster-binding protein, partial [Desulfobacterales bacterium]
MSDATILVMNGHEFTFEAGETILDVARRNGIDIPTLCHLKGTTATGACRICVVEVEGARSLLAACATPAGRNMVVRTESPGVIQARRTILKLMLSSG